MNPGLDLGAPSIEPCRKIVRRSANPSVAKGLQYLPDSAGIVEGDAAATGVASPSGVF